MRKRADGLHELVFANPVHRCGSLDFVVASLSCVAARAVHAHLGLPIAGFGYQGEILMGEEFTVQNVGLTSR